MHIILNHGVSGDLNAEWVAKAVGMGASEADAVLALTGIITRNGLPFIPPDAAYTRKAAELFARAFSVRRGNLPINYGVWLGEYLPPPRTR